MLEYISPASEFPNDNADLHRGAIWVCATPCAAPTAELPEAGSEVYAPPSEVVVPSEIAVASEVGMASASAIAPAPSDTALGAALPFDLDVAPLPSSPILDDDEEIEIVDDLDAIDVASAASSDDVSGGDDAEDAEDADDEAVVDADASDPFSIYVQTLTEVMIAAGGGDAAGNLVVALSGEPTANAWRRIISGESEDFTACGAKSLDEWSAELVARLIAMPAKTDQLRRELRARGVAAFGLVL